MSKMHNNSSNIIPKSALFCNDSKPAYLVHMTEQASLFPAMMEQAPLFPAMMEQAPLFHSYDDGEMEPRYHTPKHDMEIIVRTKKKAHHAAIRVRNLSYAVGKWYGGQFIIYFSLEAYLIWSASGILKLSIALKASNPNVFIALLIAASNAVSTAF